MKKQKEQHKLKLCVDCFNCKKQKKKIYCKLGVWEEYDNGHSILHTPFDFNCPKWDEA
jgi:hypothetical protein